MNLIKALRTAIWWSVAVGGVLIFGVPLYLICLIDKRRKFLNFLTYIWAWLLLKIAGCKLKIENEENLKKYPRFIIVSNHQSYFDIFTLICLIRKTPHFLAKKELFRIPIFSQLMRMACVVEVDREHPEIAIENIKEGVSKGLERPVAIFPEGTRSMNGKLQPFKKRGLNLLMDTGLPIVPVTIEGTRDAMPKKKYWVSPATIRVKVGEPFFPGVGLSDQEKNAIRERIWTWIAHELERTPQ